MASLESSGLAKRYGHALALSPTYLKVEHGEFLTLLGPSGSGKTTLLQMIAGLIAPSEGRLLIDGKDATHLPAGARGIGMVFQNYALFPHLTAWENVAYPLRMRRMARAPLRDAVDGALRMVRMEDFAHRFPRELSGGQQQRIALARCFVYRPSVILLDEPLGALDKKLREHMQLEIRRLHKDLGATFIYVTHDQEEALTLSDRICLMNQARVEQIGTPQEIYDRPASRFAAGFIGHSNLLEGEVATVGGGARALRVGSGFLIPLPPQDGVPAGRVSLLVRPEITGLVRADEGFLRGTISEVVFTGAEYRAVVEVAGLEAFVVRCDRQAGTPATGEVGIRWDAARTTLLAR
jgi:putative spermidine/putrescine transport system ATP-binding protein